MASFSRDTFAKHRIERLKHYVSVRLQQGVPLVDADWNEMDDIRKYELRTFLKWFVGDGIPQQNNDAFRIVATPDDPNNFIIKGGDGTWQGAARCLVDGWEVFNPDDIKYTEQELYMNTALAKAWGVTKLPPLLAPVPTSSFNAQRTDTVYLDIWERPVDSLEDSTLNNEAIGIETSVRMKREWVVRVEVNASKPPAPPPGHAYYALARLDRRAREEVISTERITDLRRTGLTLMSQHDITQITKDAFGEAYPLDQTGTPQFKISLRDAVNALIAGEIPTTKEVVLAESCDAWAVLQDSLQDVWLIWCSQASSPTGRGVTIEHYDNNHAQWQASFLLTSSESGEDISQLCVAEDGQKNIWVFWQTRANGNSQLWCRRFLRNAANPWQPKPSEPFAATSEEDTMLRVVTDHDGVIWIFWNSKAEDGSYSIQFGPSDSEGNILVSGEADKSAHPTSDLQVFVERSGNIWLIWTSSEISNSVDIYYKLVGRRFDPTKITYGARREISLGQSSAGNNTRLVQGPNDTVWVFFQSSANIAYVRLHGDDDWTKTFEILDVDVDSSNPFPIVDNSRQIWVFWHSSKSNDITYKRQLGNQFVPVTELPNSELTTDNSTNVSLEKVFLDSNGDIWTFWTADNHIWYKRYSPERGWGRTAALTKGTSRNFNSNPVIHETADGNLWAMWEGRTTQRSRADIMYKELVLEL